MAAVAVAPFVLKDATFRVAADNYESHVSQVQFDPAVTQQSWQGLTPAAAFTDASSPTWACTIAYAQDWKTPNSFSSYLFAHQGQTISVELVTNPGAGTWKASLIIAPGSVGGPVNAYAVGTVTLGVSGQPTFTPAVATATATDDTTDDTADDSADTVAF